MDVCDALREEVNYGCPFEGCGSPFLTWHHFDPPWTVEHHHRPEDMIALCPEHAGFADNNHYSKQQLRQLKRNPFVKDRLAYRGWPWHTEKILVVVGRAVFFGARPIVTLAGRRIVAFVREHLPGAPTPTLGIDLDLRDNAGNQIARMQRNGIELFVPELVRFRVPPRARQLDLEHASGTKVGLHLDRLTSADFHELAKNLMTDESANESHLVDAVEREAKDSDGLIPVLKVLGRFFTNEVTLDVTEADASMTLHCYGNETVRLGSRIFGDGSSLGVRYNGLELFQFG